MKVLLINGSPRPKGCTFTALSEVEKTLNKNGVETELVQVGNNVRGCAVCGYCSKNNGCAINTDDDKVNYILSKVDEYDGIVVGSPVYYSSASGQITSFLDRLFYASKGRFAKKVAACVVSCRRGGATATFEQLNKYFSINNMVIATSNYWNQVHGGCPEDVAKDEEGLQTLRTLGENMSWLIRCIKCAEDNGVKGPEYEQKIMTNFIR